VDRYLKLRDELGKIDCPGAIDALDELVETRKVVASILGENTVIVASPLVRTMSSDRG
jgi:hypothetical protein